MKLDLSNYEILEWYLEAGVDEITAEDICNYFEVGQVEKITEIVTSVPSTPKDNRVEPKIVKELKSNDNHIQKETIEKVKLCKNLEELKELVANFEGCSLKSTAMNTVFGDGNHNAKIMIIGEAPGADEDRQGIPFVGRSGKLLDKILKSIGVLREDIYITNIIPWRPPGNRKPTNGEVAICLPFVKRTIDIISPEIIILLGGSASASLLNTTPSISKIRGSWLEYDTEDKKILALATFHPAYLLRSPIQKAKTWQDMIKISKKIKELGIEL